MGPPARVSLAPLGALAALTLLACGASTKTVTAGPSGTGASAAGTAQNPTSTGAQPTTGNSSTGTGTSSSSKGGGGESAPTPSEPPSTIVHLSSFQSPTGNIGCMLIAGIARCDIQKRSWSPAPRPPSCPDTVDFGQGLQVGASGAGRFVCAGDTARDPRSPKLSYGTGSQVGDFVCVSRASGVTCTNRHTGHGFFISIQAYRLF